MHNNDIKKTLVSKAFKDKLAHFYIVDCIEQKENFCYDWCLDLIKQIRLNYGDNMSTKAIESSFDFLNIKPNQDKNYIISDFDELFSFINYDASSFKRKYVIINDAHKLNKHTSNKLLKTLEEPNIKITIFILNNKNMKLLSTIESRGIKIRLKDTSQSNNATTLAKPEFEDIHQLISELKSNAKLENEIMAYIAQIIETKPISDKYLNDALNYFKQISEDKEYNNPIIHRANILYKLINSSH
ncbi:MAG: hypothetical protein N4A33_00125 [Bacteriovoracaceae bacterium]|jgi:DNA polymerase III delta prime subunit|nr:hypothetical protein [Bacteriovoracaceae bacterium]